MSEDQIYKVANAIHERYFDQDLDHDSHGIWQLSGDCLKQLIVPFDRHPLAVLLMECMVDYYCQRYQSA